MSNTPLPDVCILHDQFQNLGGAERVAIEEARALDAPIYAARVNDDIVPSDVDVHEVFDRWARWAQDRHYLMQDAAQMLAWQHLEDAHSHDVVLVNKTNPLWYTPREDQTVVGYLHSTPRGMYDQYARKGGSPITRIIKTGMKALYETNRITPDAWATNSDLVKRRADLYWDRQRDITVIYPPVSVSEYGKDTAPTQDFYLVLGRLRDHKRVDEVISAANQEAVRLVVAGKGPERERLEELAGETVEFRGYVSEAAKCELLAAAKAVVMPAENEDFGIVPIEAFASGTPVIGVDEGFTRFQIQDGTTGMLYRRGTTSLCDALRDFERDGVSASSVAIEEFAQQFSVQRFHEEILDFVVRAHDRVERDHTPQWDHPEDAEEEEEQESEIAVADGGDAR